MQHLHKMLLLALFMCATSSFVSAAADDQSARELYNQAVGIIDQEGPQDERVHTIFNELNRRGEQQFVHNLARRRAQTEQEEPPQFISARRLYLNQVASDDEDAQDNGDGHLPSDNDAPLMHMADDEDQVDNNQDDVPEDAAAPAA